MQKLQYQNLKDFCNSKYFAELNTKTLCVVDIDGVLFDGITDPHFWFSRIKKEYLDELQKLVTTGTNIWIFTDRNLFGFWGPYKKQLLDVLSENGTVSVERYKSSKNFLDKTKTNTLIPRALILNAKKPGQESQNVIIESMIKYSKVFYIAGQDLPFMYDDKKLVNTITAGKNNLYFIDIRK